MSESPNDSGESPSYSNNSYKYRPAYNPPPSYSSGESPDDDGESPSHNTRKSYTPKVAPTKPETKPDPKPAKGHQRFRL